MDDVKIKVGGDACAKISQRLYENDRLHQVVEVPGFIWPSLWDYSRKAILLAGHVSIGVGRVLLRSIERNRPEWEWATKVIRVSYLRLCDVTEKDARMLGYQGPQPTAEMISVAMSRGAGRYDFVTLVEFE